MKHLEHLALMLKLESQVREFSEELDTQEINDRVDPYVWHIRATLREMDAMRREADT